VTSLWRWLDGVRRGAWIAALTAWYGARFVLRASDRPAVLRDYLQACGGAFVKLGQVLALRYDYLPARYCDALGVLLDRLPPIPFSQIRPIIESTLGQTLEAAFARVEEPPVSTASVAQVHYAERHDGRRVAVKVLRPDIERLYRADLRLMRAGLALAGWAGGAHTADLHSLARDLEDLAEGELDLRVEARNVEALRERFAADEVAHRGPEVHWDLSGRRVLTMEWLDGVSVRELLDAVSAGDAARLEALAARGATPERTAQILLESIVTQCFTHRVFHADPHAANLIVQQDGTLAYVDFGMVGWIDERAWDRQFRLNLAIARNDVDAAYQALLDTLEPLPDRDLRNLEIRFKQRLHGWLLATRIPFSDVRDRSLAVFLEDVFAAIRAERLRMATGDLRLNRALLISDIVILQLNPGMRRLPALEAYFAREFDRLAQRRLDAQLSREGTKAWLRTLAGLPDTVRQLSWWVDRRLPLAGRPIARSRTTADRLAELGLRHLRLLLVFSVVVLLAAPQLATIEAVRPLMTWLAAAPWRLAGTGVAVVGIVMLSRAIAQFR
jgi:ubiquinone biosynthesis protein